MHTHSKELQRKKNSDTCNAASAPVYPHATSLTDNRPQAAVQKKQVAGMQGKQPASLPLQKKANKTGLPDQLKSGIENLSGVSMNDVKVHYNSAQPAAVQAHAYAQGTDIHVAPGQEKHLPHEAWHVVQQKQGRVKPTKQLKSKININDDKGLEHEADTMGTKALEQDGTRQLKTINETGSATPVMQRLTMSVGELQEAHHDGKQLTSSQRADAQVITDAEANYRKATGEKQVHPWDTRFRPFNAGPLATIGQEQFRIYGHGQGYQGEKSIAMIGGYTPKALADKLIDMGLPANYASEIYLTGCDSAVGRGKGYLGKFYELIKAHAANVTVRGNIGTAVTLPNGRQGVWTGVLTEEKYQKAKKALTDKQEGYLEKNRKLRLTSDKLMIENAAIKKEFSRLLALKEDPPKKEVDAVLAAQEKNANAGKINTDAVMEVKKFIDMIAKAIRDLDFIAYDFTGRLSVTLPAGLHEVANVSAAIREAEEAEKLRSAKLEIAEELAQVYGWAERTKTEQLYGPGDKLGEQARNRVAAQQEEAPSYIS